MTTPHCRSHCRACDTCFSSDEAFDAHRYGTFQTGNRKCRAPEKVRRSGKVALEFVDGTCDNRTDNVASIHTSIWGLIGD